MFFSYLKLKKDAFKVNPTRHLMVPSSAFHGKENTILRKENKEQSEPIKLPRRGGEQKICYSSVPHALTDNLFATTLVPFSFFVVLSVTKKILSKIMWASLIITSVSKFHLFKMHNEEI